MSAPARKRARRAPLRVMLSSFGYKHGLPAEADMVLDMRFLPNPYYVPELRALNGTQRPVRTYLLRQPLALAALEQIAQWLRALLPHFHRKGKTTLHVALGCTGGQHRSVVMAAELKKRLPGNVRLFHRELTAARRKAHG